MAPREFIHPVLNEEVRSITGHYSFLKESRLTYLEREILYLTGCSLVESACCGSGGCPFAHVPGFIVRWHYRTTDDGRPVSLVEPVEAERDRQALSQMIRSAEICSQVNF